MRQMLEDAGRAAGMPHQWIDVLGGMYHIIDAGRMHGPWNPLEYDEQALRLAVTLSFDVRVSHHAHHTEVYGRGYACELHGSDPYAATRLAITRAAASIGEKMRQEEALRRLNAAADQMGEEL